MHTDTSLNCHRRLLVTIPRNLTTRSQWNYLATNTGAASCILNNKLIILTSVAALGRKRTISIYQQHYFKHKFTFIQICFYLFPTPQPKSFHIKTGKQGKKTGIKSEEIFVLYSSICLFWLYKRKWVLGNPTSKEKFKFQNASKENQKADQLHQRSVIQVVWFSGFIFQVLALCPALQMKSEVHLRTINTPSSSTELWSRGWATQ